MIDPNGLGEGQPSVGFGFRMMERNSGIPQPTLSGWVIEKEGEKPLKPPFGKTFKVIDIFGLDGNFYSVVGATIIFGLDNYRFEKRLGVTGISQVLGYSKEWFHRLPKKGSKQYKALLDGGFTGCLIEVTIPHIDGKSGASTAKTISLRGFNKLITYEQLEAGRSLPFPPSLEQILLSRLL